LKQRDQCYNKYMLLIYLLLGVIAVGVLLLSPQGRAILKGAAIAGATLFALAVLAAVVLFLYFFVPWMMRGGPTQTTIQVLFGVLLLVFFVGSGVREWREEYRREGWGIEHFISRAKAESRGVLQESRRALRSIVKGVVVSVAIFIALMAVVALGAWLGRS
jgi:hypothetical protein